MRLEPTPKPEQALRVTTKLVTSSAILQLSSDELERAVNQEQMENPALDVVDQRICLFCGTRLYGQTCTACGHFAQPTQAGNEPPTSFEIDPGLRWERTEHFYDIDNSGFAEIDSEDEADPLARISTGESLSEALLQQLEALVPPDEAPIAEQLVGNLNERGYLEISTREIADHLHVPIERVEYVLSQLQTLEPLGIGARDLRECLLIQLQALSEQEEDLAPLSLTSTRDVTTSLAYTLIDRYLDRLGHNQFHEIARELKVSEQEVRQASMYIRSTLNPFPAHSYQEDTRYRRPGSDATYVRPDVIIRKGENGFEVELIEEKRYAFRISTGYATTPLGSRNELANDQLRRYMHHHSDRAKFFIDCVQRRWRTLKRVAELIVDYQQEFLEKGIRYLRPITRAEVAQRLNLDEGTVSRATANKYALLPNGRLIPLSDFFDGSLGVKDILRELIQAEAPKHRLSDEELARLMTARGIPMARRTVTKYREEMGIGSSRER